MSEHRASERPVAFAPFATFTRALGLVELRCRVCTAVIGKNLPVGQQKVRRVKNQTFIETQMQFTYLANYREVEIEREDGGKHVGNVCADCAPRIQTDSALLAQFCETDLAQWRAEGATITAAMDRRPVRVLRVADAIRE